MRSSTLVILVAAVLLQMIQLAMMFPSQDNGGDDQGYNGGDTGMDLGSGGSGEGSGDMSPSF